MKDSDKEDLERTYKESLVPKPDDELPINVLLRHCTKALFYEFRHQTTMTGKGIRAPYTLKAYDWIKDGITYRSMYHIYLRCDSEYEAAIVLLGSYAHWQRLKQCKWFIPYLDIWELERNKRDEAIARSILIQQAEQGNVSAARSIYTHSKNANKVGAPRRNGKRIPTDGIYELDEMLGRSEEADG